MSTSLIANFALLLALTTAFRLARSWWADRGAITHIADGVLFGAFCVAVMMVPYETAPGVFFDSRSVLLAVCGAFCGPLPTAIAAASAVAYRVSVGGDGMLTGCLIIAVAAGLGVAMHRFRRRYSEGTPPLAYLLLGFVVHAAVLVLLRTLPEAGRDAALATIVVPLMTIYPLATMLLSLVMENEERQRLVAERLQRGDALRRASFQAAPVGLVVCDAKERIVDPNPHFCDLMNRTAEELRGRDFLPLVMQGVRGDVPHRLEDLPDGWTSRSILPDGGPCWLSVDASLVPESAGAPERYVCVVEDISAERRAHIEITRLGHAVQQIGDGVVITSRTGEITFANAAFERITGWPASEVVGQTPRVLKHERTDPQVHADLWETISRGETWRGRMRNLRRDGEEYLADLIVSPVFDDAGDIAEFVGVQRDVTRQADMEGRLRQDEKMKAIGRLAGGVAHDFNNLLTVIGGYCELALGGGVDNDSRVRQLEEIRKAADRASDLTRQLLAFSRDRPAEVRPVSIGELVTGTLKMLGRLVGEDIDLRVAVQSDLPPVAADPGRMDQILMNLVLNARDAMPHGGELSISARATRSGDRVVLEVRDNGEGMTQETLDQIFEPFFTTKSTGTGLGLSTVYAIVDGLGGKITVSSQPGVATCVRVELPTCDESWTDADSEGLSGDLAELNRFTILVAEDDPGVRALVKAVLESDGYQVIIAADSDRALELAETHDGEIDVLLSDIVMPGRDGRELAEALRATRPGLRVVFMSGYTFDEVARHGLGPDARVIEKPLTNTTLLRTIRDVLSSPVAP